MLDKILRLIFVVGISFVIMNMLGVGFQLCKAGIGGIFLFLMLVFFIRLLNVSDND